MTSYLAATRDRFLLGLKYADFRTMNRAAGLVAATNRTRDLWASASRLLTQQLARRADPVRLLGMGVSRFTRERAEQPDLFDAPAAARQQRIDSMVDAVNERFGGAGLHRGAGRRR